MLLFNQKPAPIDPTRNVLDLVQAAIQRQDDLRAAELRHVREMIAGQGQHAAELRTAESERIDAIRAVDVAAVQRSADVADQRAATLAAQVANSAEALRVALAAEVDPLKKDIADLRRAQYEQAGQKTQVGESRLNVGALLGGFSVLLVLVFGVIGLLIG